MALIKCEECGREISENALKCPQCGSAVLLYDKVNRFMKWGFKVTAKVFAAMAALALVIIGLVRLLGA